MSYPRHGTSHRQAQAYRSCVSTGDGQVQRSEVDGKFAGNTVVLFFFLARIALTRRFILLICRHGPGNCNCGALDRHGHRLDSVNSRSRKGSRTPRNDTSPCVARWRVVRTCRSSCHHRCRSRFGCSTCCGGCSDQCSACRRSIVPGVCGLGYCDVARPRARALRMWIEVPSAIQPRGCCSRHISRFFWIWPLSSCRLCGKV